MQNEEQLASLSDAIRTAIAAALRGLYTALPVSLTTDSDGHTATAQSNILGLIRQDDGTTVQQALPKFDTIPVHFAGGGLMVTTHPNKAGDDGIWLGMARAIDSWHQSGGQQAPIDAREHHLSDAVFLNGLRSDPNKLANVASDSIQHRSKDGKVTHDVHPTNGTTTKVVDPSDSSSNPFSAATIYHQTTHNASGGIVQSAKDSVNNHTFSLSRLVGMVTSVIDATRNHQVSLKPPTGHSVSVTDSSGNSHTVTVHPTNGVNLSTSFPGVPSSSSISLSPGGISMASSIPSLGLPAGGVGGAALASGAAAGNVGTLGGDLSGSLPTPTVVGSTGRPVYGSNSAARAGGVAIGEFYLNNTISGTERVVCVAF